MSAARCMDRMFDGAASQLGLSLLWAEKIPPDELDAMRTLIRKAGPFAPRAEGTP